MNFRRPDFLDSPYFDAEHWRLKPGAPAEVIQEFEEYTEAIKEAHEPPDNKNKLIPLD